MIGLQDKGEIALFDFFPILIWLRLRMIPPYRLNIVQMMVQFVREICMLAWMLAMNFNYDVYTVGFKCQTRL